MSAILVSLAPVQITAAGTAKPIATASVEKAVVVYISAPATNTGNMYVGDSSVKASTKTGTELVKGTTIPISFTDCQIDLQSIFADAVNSNDYVTVSYLKKITG